jgi:hypothetical protein
VRLDGEARQALEAHKHAVMAWKAESLHYLRVHRLINEELQKRYSYLKLPNAVLQGIQRKIRIDVLGFNPDAVRKLILQIEALFVFAILKATLHS